MFPKAGKNISNKRMPNLAYIHKKLFCNGVSKKLLWTEYMEDWRLKGEIDDSISFENYMNKITEIFNIEIEKLISYKHDELENTY
jgi:hypothetical protein